MLAASRRCGRCAKSVDGNSVSHDHTKQQSLSYEQLCPTALLMRKWEASDDEKTQKKRANERIAASLSRIEVIEAEEFARRLLGNAEWNRVEERREKKFQEIMQSLSAILGPNVDLEQEATAALEMWDETVGMEDALRDQTPFELLLREYYYISKEMIFLFRMTCGRGSPTEAASLRNGAIMPWGQPMTDRAVSPTPHR